MEHLKDLSILSNPVTDYAPLDDLGRTWDEIDITLDLARQATDRAKEIADSAVAQGLDAAGTIAYIHDTVVKTTAL